MATITITYTAPTKFATDPATQQIFGVWNPATTASDNEVFAGTYYQTNKWDNGEFPYATTLQAFLDSQVAHPGLIAALRAAVRSESGTYEWAATDADVLYVEELEGALKDQGFTFATSTGSDADSDVG